MRIVIADTETTGLDTKKDAVVEYAHLVCRVQKDGMLDTLVVESQFETLLNPNIPIPAGATAVHGISDAMVAGAPQMADILPHHIPIADDVVYCGHNFLRYDMNFLAPHFPRHAMYGCTLRAAKVYLVEQQGFSLDKLKVDLGLESGGRAHSALGDVYTTLALINYLLAARVPWAELWMVMMRTIDVMPFGKNKGKPLTEISPRDRKWLLEEADAVSWELRRALEDSAHG